MLFCLATFVLLIVGMLFCLPLPMLYRLVGRFFFTFGPPKELLPPRHKVAGPVDPREYIDGSTPEVYGACKPGKMDVLEPFGIWRGHWQEDDHDLVSLEFILNFAWINENEPGLMTGSGCD